MVDETDYTWGSCGPPIRCSPRNQSCQFCTRELDWAGCNLPNTSKERTSWRYVWPSYSIRTARDRDQMRTPRTRAPSTIWPTILVVPLTVLFVLSHVSFFHFRFFTFSPFSNSQTLFQTRELFRLLELFLNPSMFFQHRELFWKSWTKNSKFVNFFEIREHFLTYKNNFQIHEHVLKFGNMFWIRDHFLNSRTFYESVHVCWNLKYF